MTIPESSVRNREIGRRLRSAQQSAGLTGTELADSLGWTTTALSRTMTGRRTATDIDVAALLATCHVASSERERVVRLCRSSEDPGCLRLPDHEHWSAYLAHASDASRLIEFQPFIVPWMLQTPDYTRALITTGVQPSTCEAEIAARRLTIPLTRLPRVEILLHEWLLRTLIRDETTMSEQLHHLMRMSVRPSLSLRIVPIGHGAYVGRHGAFTLLEFGDHAPMLYREEHSTGLFLGHGHEITACRSVIERLAGVALDEQQSRHLIGEIAMTLYSTEADQPDRTGPMHA